MSVRDRFAVILGLRIGGAVLVVLGLYLWLGGRIGGSRDFGTVLVVAGFVALVALPRLLVRRWRSRP